MLTLLTQIRRLKKRSSWSREQMVEFQQAQLRELVAYAWNNSPFYKKLYSEHGIAEADLPTMTVEKLPVTSKELLMQNFDQVVTDQRLHKAAIEEWIQLVKDPHQRYENEFVVMHTSGTSGNIGVYLYDKAAWNTLKASVITRVSSAAHNPLNKSRVAFFGATHGRFAGVTLASDAPKILYDVLLLSVLRPMQETVEKLNDFKPNQITGYASAITQLAELQIAGQLSIKPERITTSGDPLSESARHVIRSAWGIDPLVLYAASESIGIAAQLPGQDTMTVFDDLHVVEVLDEVNAAVASGQSGRVVLTNLYNRVLPIIRYDMRDVATRGPEPRSDEQFSHLKGIHGRVSDALPIVRDNGATDSIHPIVLAEFFVPGLQKIQFVSRGPAEVELVYVAAEELDQAIQAEFFRLLHQKEAVKSMTVTVRRAEQIENDERTGKFRLVVL